MVRDPKAGDSLSFHSPWVTTENRRRPPVSGEPGRQAAEWHRYLHAEGILVEDEGEECGPWHHRVFLHMAEASTGAALDRNLDIELTEIAAAMVRGELTCEKGHRAGKSEHVHFVDVHRWGRRIAVALARARLAEQEGEGR